MMFIFLKTARSDNASTATLYIITLHHADTQKKPVPCNSMKHKESHHYMNQPERDGQTH